MRMHVHFKLSVTLNNVSRNFQQNKLQLSLNVISESLKEASIINISFKTAFFTPKTCSSISCYYPLKYRQCQGKKAPRKDKKVAEL